MSEYEARACPHCGNAAEVITRNEFPCGNKQYARCAEKSCLASRWIDLYLWNNRPLEDALQARIAELESEAEDNQAASVAAAQRE